MRITQSRCTGLVMRWSLAIAFVLVAADAALAVPQTFNWTNAAGSTGLFMWSGGHNVGVDNFYQDPTIINVGFKFQDTLNFRAVGGGGIADSVANKASATVTAQSLGLFDKIMIEESGTWSTAAGVDPTSVLFLQADIMAQALQPVVSLTIADFSTSLVFNSDGTWTAQGEVIPTSGFSLGIVSASNTLQVAANAAPGTFFEKGKTTIFLPEPASIMLVLVGLFPVVARRRSRRMKN